MVIKVPIYVDIEKVDPQDLPDLVNKFSRNFYKFLREKELMKAIRKFDTLNGEKLVPTFKVISLAEAHEYLRKGRSK